MVGVLFDFVRGMEADGEGVLEIDFAFENEKLCSFIRGNIQ